jgi:hypothetical protein
LDKKMSREIERCKLGGDMCFFAKSPPAKWLGTPDNPAPGAFMCIGNACGTTPPYRKDRRDWLARSQQEEYLFLATPENQ